MFPGYDIYRVIQQLYENLADHKERLIRMEQSIQQLQEDVRFMHDKTGTHVEKIEYHFDQLKVEKLEGTLNIGITPQSSGTIEQVLTDQYHAEDVPIKPESSAIYSNITRRVHRYLDHEAAQDCKIIEKEYGKKLDTDHRKMMIEDVKRQVDERIKEYLQRQSAPDKQSARNELEDDVTDWVKRDIRLSLQNYIKKIVEANGGEQLEN